MSENYIDILQKDIDSTYQGLGSLIAVNAVAVKARKFVLNVSPSGCGKSTAMEYMAQNMPDSWCPTSLSISSLVNKADKLTSFRSMIGIDDIATIQTDYGRKTTITTLSALCYTHRVEPSMVGFDFAIEDFHGSAIVGIQPTILKDLILHPEWDASIKDKALRYYHLQRPINPIIGLPKVKLNKGIDFESVNFEPDVNDKNWQRLYEIGTYQWSRARAKEHMIDLLKAVAALNNRKTVDKSDFRVLIKLLKPMAIEVIAVNKDELEGDRILDKNLILLLTEYYSYGGEFSLAHVSQDFSTKLAQTYKIMQHQNGNWRQVSKSPTIYRPSKALLEELREFGLELERDKINETKSKKSKS